MKVSKEIKIAMVALLAIVIIYMGIIFLKGLRLFDDEVSYYVEMDDVRGMAPASDVRAAGLKVGTVKAIMLNEGGQNLTVEITVNPSFQIPQGTSVYLTKEMLGSPIMNLRLGADPSRLLAPGDTIRGTSDADLMVAAASMLPKVESILPKVDSLMTALNTLARDPAIAVLLQNMAGASESMNSASAQLDNLLASDVPLLVARTDSICRNLETTTAAVAKADIAGMAVRADSTLAGLSQITSRVSSAMADRETSLGMLMNDNTLALRLDTTLQNTSLLLEDFRLHPKRYVHFSLFGKKDK